MDENEATVQEGDQLTIMSKVWNELRNANQFVDATLVSDDGVSFHVHRAILSGYSKFFRALFSNPLYTEEPRRVSLQNVQSADLTAMLDYIYCHVLYITEQNVTSLLHASDYLSILDVHRRCVDYLRNSLNPNNCLTIRYFARDHFLEELEKQAQLYLLRNFPQVAEGSAEVLTLPLDELVPILSSDTLNVRNEEVVWRLVLRWVDHDKEVRRPHLVSLLRCIRLGLMEVHFFLDNVKNHPYILGNAVCRPVIIDTLKVLMDVETITEKDGEIQTPECARPRIPHEVMFAIGGWSGGNPTNALETYDTRADRWITVNEVDPSGPRAYHGTAVIGFDIFIIGGFDGMENFNSCKCFNAVSKTWREIAPMHERRCYVSVVVMDDVIYAMGGYNGQHRQNTAEKYDHRTNQWTTIAPMHVQRSDASATVLNGKVYITGGFDGRECLNSAEVYDPVTNVWTLLPPMRSRRSGVSCIAYHDTVCVLGGFNGVSRMASAERYTPSTNQWTSMPDMYTTRSNFAIEVIDDMVFAIGGFNGIATIHQVECFDDRANEWYEATDMNVFRSALSACVIGDLPNINEYIHQNRHMLMEEKRQRMLAARQNNENDALSDRPAVFNITRAIQEVNNAVGIMDVEPAAEDDGEVDGELEGEFEDEDVDMLL